MDQIWIWRNTTNAGVLVLHKLLQLQNSVIYMSYVSRLYFDHFDAFLSIITQYAIGGRLF
jgi:hypothetical protein